MGFELVRSWVEERVRFEARGEEKGRTLKHMLRVGDSIGVWLWRGSVVGHARGRAIARRESTCSLGPVVGRWARSFFHHLFDFVVLMR